MRTVGEQFRLRLDPPQCEDDVVLLTLKGAGYDFPRRLKFGQVPTLRRFYSPRL